MTGRLDGKIAIITGAAGDQGAAEARLFVAEGARVIVSDIRDDEGREVAASIGEGAKYVSLDVTDPQQWAAAIDQCVTTFGDPTILVNNAGVLSYGPIETLALDELHHVLDVNVVGALLGIQAVVPAMERAGVGSIVNIASINGIRASALTAAYSASKFALRGITMAAAAELTPRNIRVNSICPGAIDSRMTRGSFADEDQRRRWFAKLPSGRIGEPAEVAELAVFLASDASSYCTGSDFVVDGGRLAAG